MGRGEVKAVRGIDPSLVDRGGCKLSEELVMGEFMMDVSRGLNSRRVES